MILSHEEVLVVLTMPTDSDIDTTNFEFGRIASHAAGLRDGSMD